MKGQAFLKAFKWRNEKGHFLPWRKVRGSLGNSWPYPNQRNSIKALQSFNLISYAKIMTWDKTILICLKCSLQLYKPRIISRAMEFSNWESTAPAHRCPIYFHDSNFHFLHVQQILLHLLTDFHPKHPIGAINLKVRLEATITLTRLNESDVTDTYSLSTLYRGTKTRVQSWLNWTINSC